MKLNTDLIDKIKKIYDDYKAANDGKELLKIKIDYLAERSIEDDVEEESS